MTRVRYEKDPLHEQGVLRYADQNSCVLRVDSLLFLG